MPDNLFALHQEDQKAFCGNNSVASVGEMRDPAKKNIATVSNLTGFYIRMIENALHQNEKNTSVRVKTAFNKEEKEDLGNAIILIRRMDIIPNNLSIRGDKSPLILDGMEGLPDLTGVSIADSYSIRDMFEAHFTATIYGNSLAEVSRLQEEVFRIIFASSFGVLSDLFDNIANATPPTATPIDIQERNIEVYVGVVSFSAQFIDTVGILMRGTVIQSAKIAIRELPSENILEFPTEE